MRALAAIAALLLVLAPVPATAQDAGVPLAGQVRSPILTIDTDRLFAGTRYGQRISEELGEQAEALEAENERLRAELTAEERSLTERRPTMEVEAFRAEAEAFDVRVQGIRNDQDAKQQALEQAADQSRDAFLNAVSPVLAGLMIESGAGVILEQRQVFLSASLIDITDEAIAAIDAELGDGADLGRPEAPGETEPEEGSAPPGLGAPAGAEDGAAPADGADGG